MSALEDVRADRRLLLPGSYPPLTHLGATLLRHATHTALRYGLYQLGETLPESPPTRFVALRLYLDAVALDRVLTGPTSKEILGALLDPGGVAAVPLPLRLRGALWFHRRRLRVKASAPGRLLANAPARRRIDRGQPNPGLAGGVDRASESDRPSAVLSRGLPALGEALLGDLLAALDRRQQRAAGREVARVQSAEAARFLRAAPVDLTRLGLPDPVAASWSHAIPAGASETPGPEVLAHGLEHRLRGGFREQYRHLLDLVRPSLLALGDRAVARGYLASRDDLFFVPFELIDDLDGSTRPNWLQAAVASNRAEWEELSGRNAPTDTLGNVEPEPRVDLSPELAPLVPLV
jgi:hypothetical protein